MRISLSQPPLINVFCVGLLCLERSKRPCRGTCAEFDLNFHQSFHLHAWCIQVMSHLFLVQ